MRVILVLLLLGISNFSFSQDAYSLISILDLENDWNEYRNELRQSLVNPLNIENSGYPDELLEEHNRYADKIDALIEKHFAWEILEVDLAESISATFSSKELEDIAKFYQTSAGRKLLSNNQDLQDQVTQNLSHSMESFRVQAQVVLKEHRGNIGRITE